MFSGSLLSSKGYKARAITYFQHRIHRQGRALLTTPPSRPLGLGISLLSMEITVLESGQ